MTSPHLIARLPFFYGWVIVGVTFVTMAIGVNARTAFSLLFPPILDEFGWDRAMTAGAFSFGFVVAAILSPYLGKLMDRRGPLVVMEAGSLLLALGLMVAAWASEPWHFYVSLGVLVGGGSVCLGYSGQALFLPNWFVRRRGRALATPTTSLRSSRRAAHRLTSAEDAEIMVLATPWSRHSTLRGFKASARA